MYCLSEQQIDYILDDIKQRGVEIEDLQMSLLDHVCCIIERDFNGNDFEQFYQQTIRQFFKIELKEIEQETINLLTFKNYYAMKKFMIMSGIASAIAFIIGSFFKIMHWPGAGLLLILAILSFSLVFLPLLFVLKTRETRTAQERILLTITIVLGILYSIGILFTIHHWPGNRILWLSTLALSFFVLLPVYFFSGIRKPETRTNTIVTTIVFLAFLGCEFTLTSLHSSPHVQGKIYTYVQSEHLLQKMLKTHPVSDEKARDIQQICSQMKAMILHYDFGVTEINNNFDVDKIASHEKGPENSVFQMEKGKALLEQLRQKVALYNQTASASTRIQTENTILDPGFANQNFYSNLYALNDITQLQIFVADAEDKKLALK